MTVSRLNDLVSYSSRNTTRPTARAIGTAPTRTISANYGVEGESDDPAIEAVRQRQIKNFLLTLAISRGVPMLLAGDEFRRTQRGNNNAYCQDNETSWVDWSLCQRHDEIVRFARNVFAFRRDAPRAAPGSFLHRSGHPVVRPARAWPRLVRHALAKPGVSDS